MTRLTVKEAAVEAHRHPDTIRKSVEAGTLHGSQRAIGGPWLIREECLDAYLDGAPCEHQNVTPIRRRA